MNNPTFPFGFFPNGIPNQNNQNSNSNPFLNMMQNNPFMDLTQSNNINDLLSNIVDKNTVNTVFSGMISNDILPIKLHEPERQLDLLLYLSEKTFLNELNETNKTEFEEFIKMFRTSDNSKPERKLVLFLNLLNYYTKKQNILVNQEEKDNFEPNIEPVD